MVRRTNQTSLLIKRSGESLGVRHFPSAELITLVKLRLISLDEVNSHYEWPIVPRERNCTSNLHQRKYVDSTTSVPNFQDAQLKEAIDNYQKRMWVNIGKSIGMSPGGCKKRAAEQNFLKKL